MLNENEVVMLILGICVMILIFMNINHTRRIRAWKVIFSSYCILLSGWFFTVLEGFFLSDILNTFEHISYMLSALLLSVWTWKITGSGKKEEKI